LILVVLRSRIAELVLVITEPYQICVDPRFSVGVPNGLNLQLIPTGLRTVGDEGSTILSDILRVIVEILFNIAVARPGSLLGPNGAALGLHLSFDNGAFLAGGSRERLGSRRSRWRNGLVVVADSGDSILPVIPRALEEVLLERL